MNHNKSGFTLIELLAVVLIIAILTSVSVPQYRRSVQRAEAIEALTNLRAIYDSAKRYRAANSEAPLKLNGLDVSFFDADTPNSSSFNIGKFHYTFSANNISACRIDGNNSYSNTYCFRMYYVFDSGTKRKDLLTCSSNSEKYKWLCEALSDSKLGSLYVIGS